MARIHIVHCSLTLWANVATLVHHACMLWQCGEQLEHHKGCLREKGHSGNFLSRLKLEFLTAKHNKQTHQSQTRNQSRSAWMSKLLLKVSQKTRPFAPDLPLGSIQTGIAVCHNGILFTVLLICLSHLEKDKLHQITMLIYIILD